MNKAFDKVHQSYLLVVMKLCLETVKYLVIVNEDFVRYISLRRGLRQGGPLPFYLFIICTEGLSTLIKRAKSSGDIHCIKVCKGASSFLYLLFVDDCFLFCRAIKKETNVLVKILDFYGQAYGQQINFQKFEILFSTNTS